MHFLMFRFKRAHLRSLAIARRLAKELQEITPARFDIMSVLSSFGTGQMLQYDLWKALGISRAAGSKMVRRLIELGFLTRWPSPGDKRTFVVAFTEQGAAAMRQALVFLYQKRPFRTLYERAFGDLSDTTAIAVKNLDWAVRRVATYFRDTAWNIYPTATAEDIYP